MQTEYATITYPPQWYRPDVNLGTCGRCGSDLAGDLIQNQPVIERVTPDGKTRVRYHNACSFLPTQR